MQRRFIGIDAKSVQVVQCHIGVRPDAWLAAAVYMVIANDELSGTASLISA